MTTHPLRSYALALALCAAVVTTVFAQQPEPVSNGKPLSHWMRTLADKQASRRVVAIESLMQLGPQALPAVPALAKALSDPEEAVRREAARAILAVGLEARAAIPALNKALADPCIRVRVHAAQALVRLDAQTRAPALPLADALKDRTADAPIRYLAGQTLQELGPRAADALPALVVVLRDPDGNFSSLAAATLAALGPTALPKLVPHLKDEHPACRQIMASTISNALQRAADFEQHAPSPPPTTPPQNDAERLQREQARKEYEQAERLRQVVLKENRAAITAVLPNLIEALGDDDETTRNTIGGVLPRVGKLAVPGLTAALTDKNLPRRVLAAQALGRIDQQTQAPIPVLAAALESTNTVPNLRALAVQTLAEFGGRSQAALPALLRTLADPDPNMAGAAAGCLNNLGIAALAKLTPALKNQNVVVRQHVSAALMNIISNALSDHGVLIFNPFSNTEEGKQKQAAAEKARQERFEKKQAVIAPLIPTLIAALADEDEQVRNNLRTALICAGAPVVPPLLRTLQSDMARVRLEAVQVLLNLNLPDKERAPIRQALARLKDDPDPNIRAAVEQAPPVQVTPPVSVAGLSQIYLNKRTHSGERQGGEFSGGSSYP